MGKSMNPTTDAYCLTNYKIKWDIQHTFKFRTGDTDEKGGCTFIGGSWVDKTTDELFKGKRIVLFSLLWCIYTNMFR